MPNYEIKELFKHAQDLGYNIKDHYIITFTETPSTYAVKYYGGILEGADRLGFFLNNLAFFGSKRISVKEAFEKLNDFMIKRKELMIEQKKKTLKQDFK